MARRLARLFLLDRDFIAKTFNTTPMRKNFYQIGLIGMIPLAAALVGDTPDELAPPSDNIIPFADANEFKAPKSVTPVDQGYRNTWQRLSGFEYSGLHWNHFVVVYVNKEADVYNSNYIEYSNHFAQDDWGFDEEETSGPEFKKYSEKTIFLKEHFTSVDGKPSETSFITTMEKMPAGYDSDFGDWRYVWADGATGQVLQEGNSRNPTLRKSCIDCHANMAERDYIFATVSIIGN